MLKPIPKDAYIDVNGMFLFNVVEVFKIMLITFKSKRYSLSGPCDMGV